MGVVYLFIFFGAVAGMGGMSGVSQTPMSGGMTSCKIAASALTTNKTWGQGIRLAICVDQRTGETFIPVRAP